MWRCDHTAILYLTIRSLIKCTVMNIFQTMLFCFSTVYPLPYLSKKYVCIRTKNTKHSEWKINSNRQYNTRRTYDQLIFAWLGLWFSLNVYLLPMVCPRDRSVGHQCRNLRFFFLTGDWNRLLPIFLAPRFPCVNL